MKLSELATCAGLKIVSPAADPDIEVSRVYAADTMSELIGHASAGTMLLTHLDNSQLARIAELMDAPAICLLDGAAPGKDLLAAAAAAGPAVLVSEAGRAETLRALQGRLAT